MKRSTIGGRRGFTLIEMLMVMTAITLIIGLSVLTFAALTRAGRHRQAEAVADAELERLAAAFRADLHAATAVTGAAPTEGPRRDRLVLTRPDGAEIRYEVQDRRVEVTRPASDPSKARRTVIRLRPELVPHLELVEDDRLACLVLSRDGRPVIRIEAAVGRDHRFAPVPTRKETPP